MTDDEIDRVAGRWWKWGRNGPTPGDRERFADFMRSALPPGELADRVVARILAGCVDNHCEGGS